MKEFFEKNKTFLGIIIAALIIGGFIYFSKQPQQITPAQIQPTVKEQTQTIPDQSQPKPQLQPTSACISYTEAGEHIGEYGCVRGIVDHVYTSQKSNNFLNFCSDYRTCPFNAVIFNSDAYKFSNIKQYAKRTVEISGLIKTYQGRAEIIINEPKQIRIIK